MEGGPLAMSQKERLASGHDEQGEGEGNDDQRGSGSDGDKLPAKSADIQTI